MEKELEKRFEILEKDIEMLTKIGFQLSQSIENLAKAIRVISQ